MSRSHTWAVAAPLLCAAHCAAAPVLVLLAPALAPTPRVEWALFAGSVVLVTASMVRTDRLDGPLPRAWIPILVGLTIWAASIADWFKPVPEVATTLLGTVVVAAALIWNARRSARVRCESAAAEGDPRSGSGGHMRAAQAPSTSGPGRAV